MHIQFPEVKQKTRGWRDQSHGFQARGTAWKYSRVPLGNELWEESRKKKGTIKPNTKYFKKGLYDLQWQMILLILKASYINFSSKICFLGVGVVKEWGQNDPVPRLVSSKGALARNAEINVELDAAKIYNTCRKKKSTCETERKRMLLLGWEKEVVAGKGPDQSP